LPSISVIIPSLNEEQNLRLAVEDVLLSFDRLNIIGECIIVNDGSSDKTARIADELAANYPFIQVIHHDRPAGIGRAFWEGAMKAKHEIVTLVPGDGENESIEILRYLPLMEHVDIVVPFVYNREVRSSFRRLLSKFYKAIINLSFGLLLNYMNGTVMYRRRLLLSLGLRSWGFFYQTELLVKAIRRGYLYAEVPYAVKSRAVGRSKALTLHSLIKLVLDYFRVIRAVYLSASDEAKVLDGSATSERRKTL